MYITAAYSLFFTSQVSSCVIVPSCVIALLCTLGGRFFSVPLPMMALTNATRFRFWQPKNGGKKWNI